MSGHLRFYFERLFDSVVLEDGNINRTVSVLRYYTIIMVQFLQVGRLDRALILLGLAHHLPSTSGSFGLHADICI